MFVCKIERLWWRKRQAKKILTNLTHTEDLKLRPEAENMIHALRHAETPAAVSFYGSPKSYYHNPLAWNKHIFANAL